MDPRRLATIVATVGTVLAYATGHQALAYVLRQLTTRRRHDV
jgi:hypothetical protein